MPLRPVMNNTKWNELRLGMYALDPRPAFQTLATNGYRAPPESEWYYHFRGSGYDYIHHVDILVSDARQRDLVRSILRRIHVPGEETPDGFRVFGYLQDGQAAE